MLALRKPVSNWLQRPTPWAAVIAGNGRIMTIYLWHMTSMIGVAGLGLLAGGIGLEIEPLTGSWWWSRPIWIGVLLLPLAGLAGLFGSFESNRSSRPATNASVVLGVLVVIWGFARLALGGFVAAGSATLSLIAPLAVLGGARLIGIRSFDRTPKAAAGRPA